MRLQFQQSTAMPRPALTEEQKQDIRKKLRKAAADLYAESGLQQISARAVAKAAGVSVGTLYAHFTSLPELMQSLWRAPVSRLINQLEAIHQEHGDPEVRLRALMGHYVLFARENREVYRGAFMFVRPDAHAQPKKVPLADDRFFNVFKSTICDGQNTGVFRTGDPKLLTQTIWSGIHGAIALPINISRLELAADEAPTEHMLDALMAWLATSTPS